MLTRILKFDVTSLALRRRSKKCLSSRTIVSSNSLFLLNRRQLSILLISKLKIVPISYHIESHLISFTLKHIHFLHFTLNKPVMLAFKGNSSYSLRLNHNRYLLLTNLSLSPSHPLNLNLQLLNLSLQTSHVIIRCFIFLLFSSVGLSQFIFSLSNAHCLSKSSLKRILMNGHRIARVHRNPFIQFLITSQLKTVRNCPLLSR